MGAEQDTATRQLGVGAEVNNCPLGGAGTVPEGEGLDSPYQSAGEEITDPDALSLPRETRGPRLVPMALERELLTAR